MALPNMTAFRAPISHLETPSQWHARVKTPGGMDAANVNDAARADSLQNTKNRTEYRKQERAHQKKCRLYTRPQSRPVSKEVQHAQMLLLIALRQEKAGIRIRGMLAVPEAKKQLGEVRHQEKSAVEVAREAAWNAVGSVSSAIDLGLSWMGLAAGKLPPGDQVCHVDGTCDLAGQPSKAWLDGFEAAARPYFNIKKSTLLKLGEAPELIVMGDGAHNDPETQERLTMLVAKLFNGNKAVTKLLVESPRTIGDENSCKGVPPTTPLLPWSAMTGCIGIDRRESYVAIQPAVKELAKRAYAFGKDVYERTRSARLPASHLNPDEVITPVSDNAELILRKHNDLYLPAAKKLDKHDNAIVRKLLAVQDAFDKFMQVVDGENALREQEMLNHIEVHVVPGRITPAVIGDAHVERLSGLLLAKYKCWVLDDKSYSLDQRT